MRIPPLDRGVIIHVMGKQDILEMMDVTDGMDIMPSGHWRYKHA